MVQPRLHRLVQIVARPAERGIALGKKSVLLALQGVSEVIKRIAALQNLVTIDAKYERPTQ